MRIGTQVAEITKPIASVDDSNGMKLIMHRSGGIAKHLDTDTEMKIRGLLRGKPGNKLVVERSGGHSHWMARVKACSWRIQVG